MKSADGRQLCDRCLADYYVPDGQEREACIQLVGEWLCRWHYEYALEHESAWVETQIRKERQQ